MTELEERRDTHREKRGRRRRRRGRFLLFLLLCAAVAAGLRFSGLIGADRTNIRTDFEVDAAELESRISADMYIYELGEDAASELRGAALRHLRYAGSISFIADHIELYPHDALNTIKLSPEKADFVALEPFIAPQYGRIDAGIEADGEVPYLLQYDSRWAFHAYGSSVVGNTGCGPTCLSMALIGLTGDGRYDPAYVADFAESNGYYYPGEGTAWGLFTDGAAALGISGTNIYTDEDTLRDCLDAGRVLIASMQPGDFTMAGHFIVIYDATPLGFRVYDPSSTERSGRLWSYERLEPQLAAVWSMAA